MGRETSDVNLKRPVNVGINLLQSLHQMLQSIVVSCVDGGEVIKVLLNIGIRGVGSYSLPVETAVTSARAVLVQWK